MYRLNTFGTLAVSDGAPGEVAVRSRARLAVLAVIADAAERGVRREKLTAMFWPDSDDERARNALRQALFAVRRDLGGAEITLGTTVLRLNPAVITADVADFKAALATNRLADAVELYRGPFLDGVSIRAMPEFDRWVDESRISLAADYARALEQLASTATDPVEAANLWARLAAHDVLSARIARRYMEALSVANDREAAIRHAAVYATAVRTELEAAPDEGVMQYAEQLRSAPSVAHARAAPNKLAIHQPVLHENASSSPESSRLASLALASVAAAPSPPSRASIGPTKRRATPLMLGFFAAAVALAIAGSRLAEPRTEAPESLIRTVAVAAIANETGDSTLDAVARRATARVRDHLVSAGHMRVVEPDGLTGVGSEVMLRGALESIGDAQSDSLQVVLDVLSARDRRVLRVLGPVSGTSTNTDAMIADLQQVATGAFASLSDSLFFPWATANSRPPRYDAYLAFLKAIEAAQSQGAQQARPHFEEAMRLDPDFPEAKIWFLEMADALNLDARLIDSVRTAALAQRGGLGAYDQLRLDRQLAFLDGRFEEMYTAARRMVSIAPNAPDGWLLLEHAAMATRRYREVSEVAHRLRKQKGWTKQIEIMRSFDFQAHRLGGSVNQGIAEWRAERAVLPENYGLCLEGIALFAAAQRPLAIDSLIGVCHALRMAPPASDGAWATAGRQLRGIGDTASSRRAFLRALAIREDWWRKDPKRFFPLAVTHCELGDWRRAYALLQPAVDSTMNAAYLTLGIVSAHVGDTARAEATLRWLAAREAKDRYPATRMLERVFVLAALGRRDEALTTLEQAAAAGASPPFTGWYNRWELESLRGDARFKQLVVPR